MKILIHPMVDLKRMMRMMKTINNKSINLIIKKQKKKMLKKQWMMMASRWSLINRGEKIDFNLFLLYL